MSDEPVYITIPGHTRCTCSRDGDVGRVIRVSPDCPAKAIHARTGK